MAAGEIDDVGDRLGVGSDAAPKFDSLLGKQVEIRWRYYTSEKGVKQQVYIWAQGEVVEIADGKTTKKSSRCKSPLPWGAVRVKWPEDADFDEKETYGWVVLKPADWNRNVHLGWRYASMCEQDN